MYLSFKRKEKSPSSGDLEAPLLDLEDTANETSNNSISIEDQEKVEVQMSVRGFNSNYMKFELERL